MRRALEQLLVGNGSHNQADADYWLVMGDEEADVGLADSGARPQRELSPTKAKAKPELRSRHRTPSKVVSMLSPLHRAGCAHEDDATGSSPGTPTGKAKTKGKGFLSKIVSWSGASFRNGHRTSEESGILGVDSMQAEEKGKRPLMVSERRRCSRHAGGIWQPPYA